MARTKIQAWDIFWQEIEHISQLSTSLECRHKPLEDMLEKIQLIQEGTLSIEQIHALHEIVIAAYKSGATDERSGRDTGI